MTVYYLEACRVQTRFKVIRLLQLTNNCDTDRIRVAGNAIGREISKLTCVVIVNKVMVAYNFSEFVMLYSRN